MSDFRSEIPKIQIYVEEEASEDDLSDVNELLKQAGLEAMVEASYGQKSGTAEELEWIVLITSGGGFAVGSFLGGFLSAAGSDAWKALKNFVDGLFARRRQRTGREGSVFWRVEDVHEELLFRDGLPDRAYREIFRAGVVRKTESSRLRWDDDEESWEDSRNGIL
jgi:hypothetical protein